MFEPVPNELNFPRIEHRILKFWEEIDAFSKLRKKNTGNEAFSFIDGPITANNLRGIGMHHAWGRTYKDIFQRYKAMLGYDQRYQNGFDCQGLWLEVEVEKDLDLNSKRDILAFGIDNFSRKCRERVNRSAEAIIRTSKRLGQWMDWEGSYYTYTDENIEYIWHFLKTCYEKGWLYKGHRVMPWCARCGTSLSQHELADAYEEVTHRAVYLKLPIRERKGEYILVWTTTPWTLTSNVALAVHPDLYYTKVKQGDDVLYIAQGVVDRLEGDYEVLDVVKGKELAGLTYDGPFDDLPVQQGVTHKIIPWDQVSEEEGTGVLHVAPGCGAEDYELAKLHGMPAIVPLDEDGIYVAGFGAFSGRSVSEVAPIVFESLKEKNTLYKLEDYTHRYPKCWRCKEELVFRLVDEWFIACDEIRPQMIEAARSVRWIPDHSGKRMEDWLNNMGDWCISRKRYWGLPLPFYETEDGELVIVGSRTALREVAVDPAVVDALPELHRPWIDEVEVRTPSGKVARRIPEVGDCWLDAGIVPFSTLRYLSDDRSTWEKWFPADFITEMREQIRLWFYSQLFMGVTLEGLSPYRTVMTYEKMNDDQGRPMHKSVGNTVWFDEAVEEIGAEPMRWLFADQNLSLNINFGFGPAEQIKRKLLTLWHSYSFFVTYARLDGFDPRTGFAPVADRSVLDRWLTAKVNGLIRDARRELDRYNVMAVTKAVEAFLEDLSNWYIRRSRRRFWKSEDDSDKASAYSTLYEALVTLVKIMAPILPFLSEEIYQNLIPSECDLPESVHLCDYPEANEALMDEALMEDMASVIRIVSLGRAARKNAGLKVRQPLSEILVVTKVPEEQTRIERLREQITEELNVKEVVFVEDSASFVDYGIRPNFRLLGAKYGRDVPVIRTALEALDPTDVAECIERGSEVVLTLNERSVTLLPEEIVVETKPKEGLIVAEEDGYVVALNTELTEALEDEGFARELVHRIQNMRKKAGFEVSDRITLSYRTTPRLEQAIQAFRDYIQTETLCLKLETGDDGDFAFAENINGQEARIAISKTA